MNMRKKLREFFTMTRRADGGFTLVELIVVIAIVAVLGGVGVPAYSGYIDKTNMSADRDLVGKVKQALVLEYYSNPNGFQGTVTLSLNKGPNCNDESLNVALTKTFGEGWENREDMHLKYDGWSATFQDSNFYSDEHGLTELLGTVDTLTEALGGFLSKEDIADLLETDGNFAKYMEEMGAQTEGQKADAAVFYVADVTSQLEPGKMDNAIQALIANQNKPAGEALGAMNNELGSTLASTAALYALAEGYANYFDSNYTVAEGKRSPRDILRETTENLKTNAANYKNETGAFEELMDAFTEMGQVAVDGNYPVLTYMDSDLKQDLNAYADTLKTVSASKNSILTNNGDLGEENYFSSSYVSGLLSAYSEGSILVYILGDGNVASSIDEEVK